MGKELVSAKAVDDARLTLIAMIAAGQAKTASEIEVVVADIPPAGICELADKLQDVKAGGELNGSVGFVAAMLSRIRNEKEAVEKESAEPEAFWDQHYSRPI